MAYGGFHKSSNAPTFQASPTTGIAQVFESNVKDIKLDKIGMVELLSRVGIWNKLLNQNAIIPGNWTAQSGISMAFQDSRASSGLFGGLVPRKWISRNVYVRGFLANYEEHFGAIKVDLGDLLRQSPFNKSVQFVNVVGKEMDSLMKSHKVTFSRLLSSGPVLAKIINSSNIAAAANKPGIGAYTIDNANATKYGSTKKVARLHVTHVNQFNSGQPLLLSGNNKRRLVRVVEKAWCVRDETSFKADATHYPASNAKKTSQGKAIVRKSFPTAGMLTVTGLTAAGDDEDLGAGDTGYTEILVPNVSNIGASNSATATKGGYFYSMLDWLDPTSTKLLFGLNRDDYNFMRAQHMYGGDIGSGATDPDILDIIFDFLTLMGCIDAPTEAVEVLVSTVWMSHVIRILEDEKSAYRDAGRRIITKFNWRTVNVQGPTGSIVKITSYNEWPSDKVGVIAWPTWKFLTDGLFQVIKDPNGNDWHPYRTDSAVGVSGSYEYISDNRTFGQLACESPISNGLITDLPDPMIGKGGKVLSPYG